jgi:hypothetical protein
MPGNNPLTKPPIGANRRSARTIAAEGSQNDTNESTADYQSSPPPGSSIADKPPMGSRYTLDTTTPAYTEAMTRFREYTSSNQSESAHARFEASLDDIAKTASTLLDLSNAPHLIKKYMSEAEPAQA